MKKKTRKQQRKSHEPQRRGATYSGLCMHLCVDLCGVSSIASIPHSLHWLNHLISKISQRCDSNKSFINLEIITLRFKVYPNRGSRGKAFALTVIMAALMRRCC